MSHEEVSWDNGVNQADFLTSLDLLNFTSTPSLTTEILQSLDSEYTPTGTSQIFLGVYLEGFEIPSFFTIGGFNKTTNRLPPDIDEFIQGYRDMIAQFADPPINQVITPTAQLGSFEETLKKAVALSLGIIEDFNDPIDISASNSDWSIIAGSVTNFDDIYKSVMGHFLSTYPYNADGSITGADFFPNLEKFLTATALLQENSVNGNPNFANLVSYEKVYFAFNPDATPASFQAKLAGFFLEKMNEDGFFSPSQSLLDWVSNVQETSTTLFLTSVDENNPEKALILDRLLRLLIEMIETLQKVGATQAEQLNFLAKYQSEYTRLQSQLPFFTAQMIEGPSGKDNLFGGTQDFRIQRRADLNPFLQGISAKLDGFRGVLEDEAKRVQSDINRTTDAVTQQVDIGTAILQQLSSLIQAIFR